MLGMIVAAFVVGLVIAMPPGPVVITTGQKAIVRGFWHAVTFNIGSVLADAFYALLVYLGLASLLADNLVFRLGLWVIGGGWLIYLGVEALRNRINEQQHHETVHHHSRWHNFRSGLVMTLFNPLVIVSWIAIAGNFFAAWNAEWPPLETSGLVALIAMLTGGMAWVMLVALVCSGIRQHINPRLLRAISIISGLLLIVYGLTSWWSALDLLL